MSGGKSVNDMTPDEMTELGGKIAKIWLTFGTEGVTVESVKTEIDTMLREKGITDYEH